ncbi:hypothetical protein FA13DRAFT_473314 [Coprinellus micaceus]|uniref:Uncharacterized protein n=1 Tax=Coprinellus micaceus TaxID=71717 RepID=A0A4Y7TBL9_COPMI|nr:hypothetical protein FA13DRAFT_473314 [Coprinellus micaceus]
MKGEDEADLDLWRSYRPSLKHLHTPVTFLQRPRPQIAAQLQRDRLPSVKNRLQVSRKCQPSTISSSLHHTRISSPASFFPILRLPILSQSLPPRPTYRPCSSQRRSTLPAPQPEPTVSSFASITFLDTPPTLASLQPLSHPATPTLTCALCTPHPRRQEWTF